MMGPGGKVAPEFEKINRLAVALGDKLPGTTADFQNMMTMLRRQGMSAQVILGGWESRQLILACSYRWLPLQQLSLRLNCRMLLRPPKKT
jgi:hypothetical protein